jgi:hypothetical protein
MTIDYDISSMFSDKLGPDEVILWTGRPSAASAKSPIAYLMVLVPVLFAAVALVMMRPFFHSAKGAAAGIPYSTNYRCHQLCFSSVESSVRSL